MNVLLKIYIWWGFFCLSFFFVTRAESLLVKAGCIQSAWTAADPVGQSEDEVTHFCKRKKKLENKQSHS